MTVYPLLEGQPPTQVRLSSTGAPRRRTEPTESSCVRSLNLILKPSSYNPQFVVEMMVRRHPGGKTRSQTCRCLPLEDVTTKSFRRPCLLPRGLEL